MSGNHRARFALRTFAAAIVLFGCVAVAHADLLFLKDGFVIQGKVRRASKGVVDSGDFVEIPYGPFWLEDGPRKISFSPRQLRIVEKRDPSKEEVFNDRRKDAAGGKPVPALLETLEAGMFNDNWERVARYRTKFGVLEERQHLGYLSPYWARIDSTKGFFHTSCHLTGEFTVDQLLGIIATHPDMVEKPGMAEREIVARRYRLITFLRQAGHFAAAQRELQDLEKAFPSQAKTVKSEMDLLRSIWGRELYEDMKRLHVAGRYKTVRKMMDNFPIKDAPPLVLADIKDLKDEYEAADKKMVDAGRLLTELANDITDGRNRLRLIEAATAMAAELQPDMLNRLDAFLGQAKQYERQKKAGKNPDLTPEQLVALAVTGWHLGGAAAETKPAVAVRIWMTRQMIVNYLKADDAAKRARILGDFGRDARLDEVMPIVSMLPPPNAEEKFDTINPTEQQVGAGGPTYLLQLPPEYRHGRSYPVLIVLHEANEKPFAMLKRWTEAAAEHGYILIAPSWQGAIGGYTYTEKEQATVLASLRDLRRRFNVDSDRVFLFGMGQGGAMAFDVSLSHPDLFAGVVTMGAHPELFPEKYFRNAQYLPFYVISGSTIEETSKKLRGDPRNNVSGIFEEWNGRGYPGLWFEYQGRGIEWFGGEVPNIMDWMRPKRRAFPLHQLGSDGGGTKFGNEFTSMRVTDNQFYWLSTSGIAAGALNNARAFNNSILPAMMSARIDPTTNVINVFTNKQVRQVSIWLGRNNRGEGIIDFDKPVTVKVNGVQMVGKKMVTPTLEFLLEDLYQRGDRQRPFLGKIDVSW